jgi:hypothetical protein
MRQGIVFTSGFITKFSEEYYTLELASAPAAPAGKRFLKYSQKNLLLLQVLFIFAV